jgi:ABC-2 type transport system ATP-binding protein
VAAGRVGAVLQDGGLLAGVAVDELLAMLRSLYPSPMTVERAVALAQLGGLERQRVDRLSGGERQRVRVAGALIGDPDLLVLDEPTVAMDVDARRSFWDAMRGEAGAGRTVLFSTHYLEEADAHADRVLVLADGRLVVDGTPSEVKSKMGARVVRATLAPPAPDRLASLPGVVAVAVDGRRVELRSADADATVRGLLAGWPDACDLEVKGVGLEDAVVALTAAPVAGGSRRW